MDFYIKSVFVKSEFPLLLIILISTIPKAWSITLGKPSYVKELSSSVRNPKSALFSHPKVYRCGDEGKDLVVNFVNLNYPDNDIRGNECNFRMVITSPQICQVRVDFVDTEMLRPVRGECLSQLFEVEGSVWPTGLPPLCGKQNDQHFYIHLQPWTTNTTHLDFKLVTIVSGEAYRFGVWLTQIDCSTFNVLKAPEGCTQYFLGEKGIVKSFNFEGSRYLNGQSYQICIRPGKGVCGIRYEAGISEFSMRKSVKATKDAYLRSGTGSNTCGMDYIMIPDGRLLDNYSAKRNKRLFFNRRQPSKPQIQTPAKRKKFLDVKTSFDRFCGGRLSPVGGENKNKPVFAKVRSNLITLQVKTSSVTEAQLLRQNPGINTTIGFKLSYQQVRSCDKNDPDLAGLSQVPNFLSTFNMNSFSPPLYRDDLHLVDGAQQLLASIMAAPDANSSIISKMTHRRNKTSSRELESLWDYLDNSEEVKFDSASEDDIYDFL